MILNKNPPVGRVLLHNTEENKHLIALFLSEKVRFTQIVVNLSNLNSIYCFCITDETMSAPHTMADFSDFWF